VVERPFELVPGPDGVVARVRLRGGPVLALPLLNRGTAFTPAEREALGLTGLLPDAVSTIGGQLARAKRVAQAMWEPAYPSIEPI
jgi:malate dehydrogenase (oxaloacetate-decarboxylating)